MLIQKLTNKLSISYHRLYQYNYIPGSTDFVIPSKAGIPIHNIKKLTIALRFPIELGMMPCEQQVIMLHLPYISFLLQ